jgi:ribose transport system permease protein
VIEILNRRRLGNYRYLAVPLVMFAVLIGLAVLRSPLLFTAGGLAGAVIVVAPLMLCTLALTPIVIAGRGSVDLSIGPLMGFINVTLVAWLAQGGITNPIAIFGWAIAVGMAIEAVQAIIILYVRVAPIIVSLSSYLVLTGVNLLIMARAGGVAPDWMATWGAGQNLLSPIFFILIAGIVLWAIFWRTTFHSHLSLTGADERMAYTSGVATEWVRIGAHLLGGVFVGLAAVCYTGLIGSGDPTQGANFTLQAVTALVLGGASLAGGRGGAIGSILGAVNMFLISNFLSTFNFQSLSGPATKLAFGLILVVSLLVNVFATGRSTAR